MYDVIEDLFECISYRIYNSYLDYTNDKYSESGTLKYSRIKIYDEEYRFRDIIPGSVLNSYNNLEFILSGVTYKILQDYGDNEGDGDLDNCYEMNMGTFFPNMERKSLADDGNYTYLFTIEERMLSIVRIGESVNIDLNNIRSKRPFNSIPYVSITKEFPYYDPNESIKLRVIVEYIDKPDYIKDFDLGIKYGEISNPGTIDRIVESICYDNFRKSEYNYKEYGYVTYEYLITNGWFSNDNGKTFENKSGVKIVCDSYPYFYSEDHETMILQISDLEEYIKSKEL